MACDRLWSLDPMANLSAINPLGPASGSQAKRLASLVYDDRERALAKLASIDALSFHRHVRTPDETLARRQISI